jgi:hypothetical protein
LQADQQELEVSPTAMRRFGVLAQEIIDHIEWSQEQGMPWWGSRVREAAAEMDALRERLRIGDAPVLMIVHRREDWLDPRTLPYLEDLPPGGNDTLAICGTPGGEVAALVLQTEDDFEPDGWPIVRPDAGETARAVVSTLRQWVQAAQGEYQRRAAETLQTVKPKVYLAGWSEIFDALEVPRPKRSSMQRRVARYNKDHDGPIIIEGQGAQPRVERNRLVLWWNDLERRFEETAQRERDQKASVSEQHAYGRSGAVVPGINGGVKKRRQKTPRSGDKHS